MITITPTNEMIAEARRRREDGPMNGHTFSDRQLIGHIAELAFEAWLKYEWIENDFVGPEKLYYDFIIGDKTLDTKGKRRTGTDRPNNELHIESRLEQERCDYYVACSVVVPNGDKVPSSIELVGYIAKSHFWDSPRLKRWNKGDDSGGGFIEKADCGKLEHRYLSTMEVLADRVRHYLTVRTFNAT